MKLDVILTETIRDKHPQVLTVISAGDLVERAVVPLRKGKSGYQHPAPPAELHKLILDLAAGRSEIPRPLLFNDRDGDMSSIASGRGARASWTPSDKLYLIDGQTRLAALAHLVDEDPASWSDKPIPVSCLIGLSELEEIEIFYLNNASRPPAVDIASEQLRRAGTALPGQPAWRFKADRLSDKIANLDPWRGRVRQVGARRAQTTIASRSFATTLRPLLRSPLFSALSTKQQSELVAAYWQGVAEVLPECFEKPTDFALQKTTGAMALNTVLIDVIERLRSRGVSLKDSHEFAREIEPALINLSGTNQHGTEVHGAQFWRSGPDGAAGAFSSDSGRRLLAGQLREALNPLTI